MPGLSHHPSSARLPWRRKRIYLLVVAIVGVAMLTMATMFLHTSSKLRGGGSASKRTKRLEGLYETAEGSDGDETGSMRHKDMWWARDLGSGSGDDDGDDDDVGDVDVGGDGDGDSESSESGSSSNSIAGGSEGDTHSSPEWLKDIAQEPGFADVYGVGDSEGPSMTDDGNGGVAGERDDDDEGAADDDDDESEADDGLPAAPTSAAPRRAIPEPPSALPAEAPPPAKHIMSKPKKWRPCHKRRLSVDRIAKWAFKRYHAQLRRLRLTSIWSNDTELIMPPPPPPLCQAFGTAHSYEAVKYWRPRVQELLPKAIVGYTQMFNASQPVKNRRLIPTRDPRIVNRRCWLDVRGDEDQTPLCWPEFSLLGFAKCGTSHFEGVMQLTYNHAMVSKERRLFDLTNTSAIDNVTWIVEQFQPEVDKILEKSKEERERWGSAWFGDLTTVFLSHLMWPAGFSQNAGDSPLGDHYATMARGVWWNAMLPDHKYLMLVRDPVDLMYSRFRHFNVRVGSRNHVRAKGWGTILKERGIVKTWDGEVESVAGVPQLFHEYVEDELKGFSRCARVQDHQKFGAPKRPAHGRLWNLWDCVGSGDVSTLGVIRQDAMASYDLLVGVYVYWLAWWLDVLGARERTLILRMEDFVANPKSQTMKFVNFMGLPRPSNGDVKLPDVVRNANVWVPKDEAPMLPKTRALLQQFYAPYNGMLAELLGDSAFNYTARYDAV